MEQLSWQTIRPGVHIGQVIVRNDSGEYASFSNDLLWDLKDMNAQESVASNRPRFFHTFVNEEGRIDKLIEALKGFWDENYGEAQGYWDLLDPRVYRYGKQYLIHISDMVFSNAAEFITFCNYFNIAYPELALPTGHLSRSSYRWPLVHQTLRGTLVEPLRGSGVHDLYNSTVIDYDNES